MEIRTWRSAIADLIGSPPGAPSGALGKGTSGWVLAMRCGDLALSLKKKKCAFLCVFHVQPKHQNGAVFVNTEGFRPCLSKPSNGAPQWALVVRLMQKGRLKSPHKSPFYVTGPFGSFWSFLAFSGSGTAQESETAMRSCVCQRLAKRPPTTQNSEQ